MTDHRPQTPGEIYDSLWKATLPSLQAGKVQIDPHLNDLAEDLRRGLTLIFQPSAEIIQGVMAFLDQVRKIEPDQHFYQADECHITVLSLFPVAEEYAIAKMDLAAYEEIIAEALQAVPGFKIEFCGVTVSADALMIQGFPQDKTLGLVRQKIRELFHARGLGEEMEKRYLRQAAHMTVMRFKKHLRDSAAFCDLLQDARQISWGTCEVRAVELVENDWFMSSTKVRLRQRYQLC